MATAVRMACMGLSIDRLEGVVEDPRLVGWRGTLRGAIVLFDGQPVGDVVDGVTTKAGGAERWLRVQLRRSEEYRETVKKLVAAGSLRLVLPTRAARGGVAIRSVVLHLEPIDIPSTRAATLARAAAFRQWAAGFLAGAAVRQ